MSNIIMMPALLQEDRDTTQKFFLEIMSSLKEADESNDPSGDDYIHVVVKLGRHSWALAISTLIKIAHDQQRAVKPVLLIGDEDRNIPSLWDIKVARLG